MLCQVCRQNDAEHWHHIVPRELGGEDTDENLLPVCRECHIRIHQETGDFERWGAIGGNITVARHGREHMKRIAKKGGSASGKKQLERKGREYFAEIGKKGRESWAKKQSPPELF